MKEMYRVGWRKKMNNVKGKRERQGGKEKKGCEEEIGMRCKKMDREEKRKKTRQDKNR